MPPTFVLRRRKRDVHKRAPLWPLRFPNQVHVRFLRKPVAFACVTSDARANDIFPCRHPTSIARHDVVQIQLASFKNFTTILAGILVALENVVASELHFLFRKPIEKEQNNHARHANFPRDGRHHFVVRRSRGKIAPTLEIVRQEIVGFIRRDDLGMTCINQRKGAPRRADVHRLPQPVQHQDMTV